MTEAEKKTGVEDDVDVLHPEDAHNAPLLHEGPLNLEDSLYYADLQYGSNNTPTSENESKPSPAASIARSPLRWVWGGSSPSVANDKAIGRPASIPSNAEVASIIDRRQLRKVTAFGAFYLITTDILGPFNAGFAISQVGFVPGVILYVVMGAVAFYTGLLLNALYLRLDSDRAPIRNFGQLTYRIWGKWGKAISDTFMLLQLLFNCGAILLSNGQSLSQIINNSPTGSHLCFIVCVLIFLILNLLLSPLRTLKSVGWLANCAVWLNIALIWCTVGFIYTSPPNFAAALSAFGIPPGPVHTSAFVSAALSAKVNGIGNMIFAYGGAMIFIDFLSEMRRPWDFWKAMACAQTLIATLYLVFGVLVYARQGQFTQSLAYFGVSPYGMQTTGNVIAVITGTIAALLYGHIAQKAVYYLVVEQLFRGPALMTPRGWIWYCVVNTIWWPLSFIVGAAIPQVQTITGLIGSVCILQFTYTFPFFLKFAFDVQIDALRGDGTYIPGRRQRVDSWWHVSRWRRGLFSGNVLSKLIHLILGLASLAMACLGAWGSGVAIQETFKASAATSFGCTPPA